MNTRVVLFGCLYECISHCYYHHVVYISVLVEAVEVPGQAVGGAVQGR